MLRIVATSDTHYKVDVKKWIPDGDVFSHAGDLMRTGYPSDFEEQLEWLAELPHKTKLYVPGNHDFHLQVYPGPALQQLRNVGVTVVGLPGNTHFQTYVLDNGKRVLGLPYVTGLPRWAFNATPDIIHDVLVSATRTDGKPDIVVSHSPVNGFLDTVPGNKHVGIDAYVPFRRGVKPAYWICGHIHESYGEMVYDETTFLNVAMCDRNYQHVNPPKVFDI